MTIQKFMFFFLITVMGSQTVLAQKEKKATHKEVMNRALNSFIKIMPYLSSQETYNSAKNTSAIKQEMMALETVFQDAKKESLLQNDLFSTTNLAISDNLSLARKSFDYPNKNFSYIRMKETIHLCFHCHAQLPEEFTSSFSKGVNNLKREKFSSDLDYAQYLFLVRNFDAAQTLYQKIIDNTSSELINAPKVNRKISLAKQQQMEEALRQILVIYAKIKRDIKGGSSYFEKLNLEGYPSYLKQQILNWNQGLKEWLPKESELGDLKDNTTMKKFVNDTLSPIIAKSQEGDSRVVDLLIGTGLLSNYVFLNAEDPDKAIALYYLGLSEASLSSTSFYSLAESYFRDCVRKYPAHVIAPKCFDEYEKSIVFGFTGSSGIRIPKDIQEDISKLKTLLEKNQVKKEKTPVKH